MLTHHRFLGPSTQWLIHFADIATISVLLFLTGGATSPPLVLFIFALLAAVFRRWNWKAVLATAIAFGLALLVANIIWGAVANARAAEMTLNNHIDRSKFVPVCYWRFARVCLRAT